MRWRMGGALLALIVGSAAHAERMPDGWLLTEVRWCLLDHEQAEADLECGPGTGTMHVALGTVEEPLATTRLERECRWTGERFAMDNAREEGHGPALTAGRVRLQVMTRCVAGYAALRA